MKKKLVVLFTALVVSVSSLYASPYVPSSKVIALAKSTKLQVTTQVQVFSAAVFVDGKQSESTDPIFIDNNGVTYFSARALGRALNKTLEWSSDYKVVALMAHNRLLEIPLGMNQTVVNGENIVTIDSNLANTVGFIKDGKTYLPLRFIAKQLDYEVIFLTNNDRPEIHINSKEKLAPTAPTQSPNDVTEKTSKKSYGERINEVLADDVEIEKKWLIDPGAIPFDLSTAETYRIEQTYINFDPEIRVRRINDGEQYTFTIKYDMTEDGIQRDEINIEITKKKYEELVAKKKGNAIFKTRYQLMVDNELVAIDLFEGDLEGLAYMEIEFPNMEEAKAFKTPEWVISDVTDDERYKNGFLARYGIPE